MPQLDNLLSKNLEVKYVEGTRAGQTEYYSYDAIYHEMTKERRSDLFKKYHGLWQGNEIELYCKCNPSSIIPMIPVPREGSYHIRSKNGYKDSHSLECNFEGKKRK